MLADARICEQATKIQDAMIICAPVISQMAAEGAVREDWAYPTQFHRGVRPAAAAVADRLARIRGVEWTPTGGGFFAFARVEGCTDSTALAIRLLDEAHVVDDSGRGIREERRRLPASVVRLGRC